MAWGEARCISDTLCTPHLLLLRFRGYLWINLSHLTLLSFADSSTNIFIAASVLIVVLVPAVLLLGAVLVMFYVRYSRDDSKDKKSQDNGSEFPSPTDHLQNDQFNLEQTYNSKTEAV